MAQPRCGWRQPGTLPRVAAREKKRGDPGLEGTTPSVLGGGARGQTSVTNSEGADQVGPSADRTLTPTLRREGVEEKRNEPSHIGCHEFGGPKLLCSVTIGDKDHDKR
jgi:hypothetical protein